MDKKELIDGFSQLESNLTSHLESVRALQEELNQVVEENNNLRMENKHLRDRLSQEIEVVGSDYQTDEKVKLTKSRLNLENIYEEGFHVCNAFYGQRRPGDEPCVFCLDVIYGERKS